MVQLGTMDVHFIAIGGAAMHNLAIALHDRGDRVTGSDDAIFDPSRSRLDRRGLLPDEMGWYPERIHAGLDAVILGMHAREDNPELARAKELGLDVYSYPEFLFNATQAKKRVVIGGSHGKTSTTAMVLHVLQRAGIDCDYMVGAQLEGFDCMVRLTEAAPVAILEGDEYLASPIDRRPKFHLYRPHIAVITGIAWDHVNVFPTWEGYVDQFRQFIGTIAPEGTLIYADTDATNQQLAAAFPDLHTIPYGIHPHRVDAGYTWLPTEDGDVRLEIFGDHNLENLNAARHVCQVLGVDTQAFYRHISSFSGASRRLERMGQNDHTMVFRDFAHSPSKVQATVQAVKNQFPERTLVAALELHTFSSLNANFLAEYQHTLDAADMALVCFNPAAVARKKLPPIATEDVLRAFDRAGLEVFEHPTAMLDRLNTLSLPDSNVLIMSSGELGGVDWPLFVSNLLA